MASEDPPKLSPLELARRQAAADQAWELKLIKQEHRLGQAERRSFHKAPGDPDWVSKRG